MDDATDLASLLDLTEYEADALTTLIDLGRTTAPDLSEASGIPKARIYSVLDELADAGYVKVIPGRPKKYEPKPPESILDRAIENERQAYESYRHTLDSHREDILADLEPRYERGASEVSPTEELFTVVDVGEPSERETRRLYREATDQIEVITKSFEYLDAVEPAIQDVLDRGTSLDILFLDPDLLEPHNRDVQVRRVQRIRTEYPAVEIRFGATRLPWRGTIVDPSMDYDSGAAILLVEELDIPLHKRQAAVTENASFVAGLDRYFSLTWEHDVLHTDPYSGESA